MILLIYKCAKNHSFGARELSQGLGKLAGFIEIWAQFPEHIPHIRWITTTCQRARSELSTSFGLWWHPTISYNSTSKATYSNFHFHLLILYDWPFTFHLFYSILFNRCSYTIVCSNMKGWNQIQKTQVIFAGKITNFPFS